MKHQILIISSEFPPGPGGIGQHAYSLAKALHKEGYRLYVLSLADYATAEEVVLFDEMQPFIIKRYSRQGGWFSYLKRVHTTFSVIKSINASKVILTGKFSLWQGWLIKKMNSKTQTFAILHGSEVNLNNRFLRWFTHHSIAASDVIIPVSKFTKSLLPKLIQLEHPQIHVIPNGIDQSPFPDEENSDISLWGTPSLLTVGHVSPRKGQHRVIKALPKLIKSWPELHYHIVGRPKNQEFLETLALALGVQDRITFHGRVLKHESLGAYYKQADIFMLLSENQTNGDVEGFGIVALEANLQGLPVVGAKYCGVEEAVDHGRSGYLVDGDNPDEIFEGVKYCMHHSENLSKGAESWVQSHQWTNIVKQYLTLLA